MVQIKQRYYFPLSLILLLTQEHAKIKKKKNRGYDKLTSNENYKQLKKKEKDTHGPWLQIKPPLSFDLRASSRSS